MNRPKVETVAIVVALTDPVGPGFEARLARFADEAGPHGEVLVVDGSGTGTSEWLAERFTNVRVIPSHSCLLAPQLWRVGLLATDARLVALATAQMKPRTGWFAALRDRLDQSGAAGVGGPIEPGNHLSITDRAVALLRYANDFPPLHRSKPIDPPGDNSLYRRDSLMACESAWLHGFWEVEVHQALRERGETLALADSAVVTFEGGTGLISMFRQRIRHSRRYGAWRSQEMGSMARLARVTACPLVPPLLLIRIIKILRAREMPLTPWLPALPCLMALASAWAIGEAVGTWRRPVKSTVEQESDLVTQWT
jgi:hypothetical protein